MKETFLSVALCEDNEADRDLIQNLLTQSGFAVKCEAFSSGEELLAAFLPGKYDVIFLDIYMGGIKGVEAATEIRKADQTVTLAFTTTSTEHALESYRLKAVSYLEKPVKLADVKEILELTQAKRDSTAYITLLIEGINRKLSLGSILYFEQMGHAVFVHTHAETLRTSQTVKLKDIEPQLSADFHRCHHSYIANLRYVSGVDKELKVFEMQNRDKVHIRHTSFSKSVKAYEEYLFRRARGGGL